MPYCVNCGVELNPGAKVCPLCQTPAWHPTECTDAEPYFPTNRPVVNPVPKHMLVVLLSSMLASAAGSCGVLNLLLPTENFWSFYVIGAAFMLWIWFVLPLLVHWPVFLKLTVDVAAVGLYVYLISISLRSEAWFWGLALPLLGLVCVLVFLLSFLLRDRRRSRLSTIALSIGAVALLALGIEFFVDRYFSGVWAPGWSLVTLAACVALIVPVLIIRRVPSLRDEARRRFNL